MNFELNFSVERTRLNLELCVVFRSQPREEEKEEEVSGVWTE